MSESKPQTLTEDQRTEVRSLLKQLSEASTARASRRGTNRPSLKATKKLKRKPNPFDGIQEGKQVNGVQLSPDCIVLPFIQRTRIVLMPFHLDNISQTREEWINMMKYEVGLELSTTDAGSQYHLRLVIEANPPCRYLHIYLEKEANDSNKLLLTNWLYAT